MATNFRPQPSPNAVPFVGAFKRLKAKAQLRRRSAMWACAAAACGALCTATVATAIGRANDSAHRLGTMTPVVVVARPVKAGEVLTAADVTIEPRPVGHVPSSAVVNVAAAIGQRSAAGLQVHEIVVLAMLRVGQQSALAAQLPHGSIGFAIPLPAGSLVPESGDRVDLFATADVATATALRVGSDAQVLRVTDGVAIVAIDQSQAAAVAAALLRGQIVLAMRPTS